METEEDEKPLEENWDGEIEQVTSEKNEEISLPDEPKTENEVDEVIMPPGEENVDDLPLPEDLNKLGNEIWPVEEVLLREAPLEEIPIEGTLLDEIPTEANVVIEPVEAESDDLLPPVLVEEDSFTEEASDILPPVIVTAEAEEGAVAVFGAPLANNPLLKFGSEGTTVMGGESLRRKLGAPLGDTLSSEP